MLNSDKPTSASSVARHPSWRNPARRHTGSRYSTRSGSLSRLTDAAAMLLMKVSSLELAGTVLLLGLALFATMGLLHQVLDLPEVHFSYRTGDCVRVVSPDNTFTCSHLPEKYEPVWVQ